MVYSESIGPEKLLAILGLEDKCLAGDDDY